jgi:hypothetical protein
MRVRLTILSIIFVLGSAAASGCGSRGPVPATGVLTWEDGTPVAKAAIVFVPKDKAGKRAAGPTKDDGSFELTTSRAGDGAVPGEYTVLVTKLDAGFEIPAGISKTDVGKLMAEFAKQRETAKEVASASPFPAMYAREETSPLSATVEVGKKIELKLKKQP